MGIFGVYQNSKNHTVGRLFEGEQIKHRLCIYEKGEISNEISNFSFISD